MTTEQPPKEQQALTTEPQQETTTEGIPAGGAEVSEYVCPDCGKSCKTPMGLEMHSRRVHGSSVVKKEKKPTPEGEGKGKPPKYTPPLTTETQVPDALSLLKNNLVIYGLSDRDASAVTTSMMNYDVDDVYELDRQLRGINMPNNRRVMLLESWINARNIEIPQALARQIGLIEPQRQSWRRTFHTGEGSPYGEGERKPSEVGELLTGVGNLVRAVKPPEQSSNDSNPVLQGVLNELAESRKDREKLRDEISTLKENETRQIISDLREDVRGLRSGQEHAINVYGTLDTGIKEIGGLAKEYFGLAKAVLGIGKEKPPIREKIGKSGIVELLPEELLAEE